MNLAENCLMPIPKIASAIGEPARTRMLMCLMDAVRALRRRFARGCLDWSECRFHLGGALGAALLTLARKRKWVFQELDSRILQITDFGRREVFARLGVRLEPGPRGNIQ
jgi:hypothetical protein